ncbi:MAG: DedA family protein [Gammaproteobacteria bacterium]
MDLETFISSYGYLAILLGTMLEGESVMLLGGFFSQRGYLELKYVMLLGFIGTYVSESFFYHLGRSQGLQYIQRRPHWHKHYEKFASRFHRHRYLLIIFYRFFYGMRSIAPFAIGASGIRPAVFHSLNFLGTMLWVGLVGTLGFYFGQTIEAYLDEIDDYEVWIFAGIVSVMLIIWLIHRYRARQI